jgi:hypothetical protein
MLKAAIKLVNDPPDGGQHSTLRLSFRFDEILLAVV